MKIIELIKLFFLQFKCTNYQINYRASGELNVLLGMGSYLSSEPDMLVFICLFGLYSLKML